VAAQGAGSHARQRTATKPVDSPPEEWIRIPDVDHETRWWIRRAQASAQEWQPIHRSIRGVVNNFIRAVKISDF
jgi:hypothetical protein